MVAYASLEEAWNTNLKCASLTNGHHPSLKSWARDKSSHPDKNLNQLKNVTEKLKSSEKFGESQPLNTNTQGQVYNTARLTLKDLVSDLGVHAVYDMMPKELLAFIDNVYNVMNDRINSMIQIAFTALVMYVLIDLLISR